MTAVMTTPLRCFEVSRAELRELRELLADTVFDRGADAKHFKRRRELLELLERALERNPAREGANEIPEDSWRA